MTAARFDGAGYAARLRAEAVGTLSVSEAELLVTATRLDDLVMTVDQRAWRGVAAAVGRRVWPRETWRTIGAGVGYTGKAAGIAALQAAKRAEEQQPDAVGVVELIVREALVDRYLSDRPLILEELEMSTEVGVLVRGAEPDSYWRAADAPPVEVVPSPKPPKPPRATRLPPAQPRPLRVPVRTMAPMVDKDRRDARRRWREERRARLGYAHPADE